MKNTWLLHVTMNLLFMLETTGLRRITKISLHSAAYNAMNFNCPDKIHINIAIKKISTSMWNFMDLSYIECYYAKKKLINYKKKKIKQKMIENLRFIGQVSALFTLK